MKYVRYFLVLLLSILLLNITDVDVYAMKTGFTTELLEEDVKETILNNLEISVLKREPQKRRIECFDINEEGLIVIACSDDMDKTILVYTCEGDFQYGYSLKTYGTVGVGWDDSNVLIYLSRSATAISISPEGEVIEICGIENTFENSSYWYHVEETHRTAEGKEYILRCCVRPLILFASNYSQLAVVDENGVENVIYDVHTEDVINMIVIVISIYVCVSLIVILKMSIRKRN